LRLRGLQFYSGVSRPLAVFCLLLTTAIWGLAFVAQKFATFSMGPLTFIAVRYLLGGLCVLPLARWEWRHEQSGFAGRERLVLLGLISVLFLGSWWQQAGLTNLSVTSTGFLTGLYVLFVPVILFLVSRQTPHPIVWLAAPLALAGIYFLSGGLSQIGRDDLLVIGCAVCWACQILLLGHLAQVTRLPVNISATTFIGAGLLAAVGALLFETPTLAGIARGWIAVVYSAVFSTAIAFSLQAIGQRYVPSANAAIILSAESLFAALGGALFLGERLSLRGYFGAGMIFVAIVLVEAVPALRARRLAACPGTEAPL
jgi:drug/metabolite transporter (DMT)-like permease